MWGLQNSPENGMDTVAALAYLLAMVYNVHTKGGSNRQSSAATEVVVGTQQGGRYNPSPFLGGPDSLMGV